MIDLHSHLLPGIDDGAPDEEASLRMARAALAGGITTMAATPHIEDGFGVDPLEVPARVAALREVLAEERVPLEVVAGGEVDAGRCLDLSDEELRAVALGGRWILLECPLRRGRVPVLVSAMTRLRAGGFGTLLAHPERAPDLQANLDLLALLVASGARCQVTAGALAGQYGGPPREAALAMLARGLVHLLASDAHDERHRRPDLTMGLAAAEESLEGLDPLAEWLVRAAPEAVVAGRDVPAAPAPPPVPRRAGLGARLRRTR